MIFEKCTDLRFYVTLDDSSLPIFRATIGSIFKDQAIQEYGTDRLSRNVGTEPPFYAA
jgi:hypothetical protein